MDAKLVEEAIEIVKKGRYEVTWYEEKAKEYNEAINLLISIAQSYLSVIKDEKVPEEKEVKEKYTGLASGYLNEENTLNIGFNSCRSQMLPLIVADRERINQLEEQVKGYYENH